MAPSAIKDHGVTRRSAFLKRTASICSALVAACLLYAALVSMANGLRLARQPYQFDYEEGNVLNAAVRIIAGLTPYPVPQSWPIVLNSYGPIPYLISAGLIRNRKPELFRPRIISLVAATIVAFEIGLLASGSPDSVLLGISLGAFFLTLPLVSRFPGIGIFAWRIGGISPPAATAFWRPIFFCRRAALQGDIPGGSHHVRRHSC